MKKSPIKNFILAIVVLVVVAVAIWVFQQAQQPAAQQPEHVYLQHLNSGGCYAEIDPSQTTVVLQSVGQGQWIGQLQDGDDIVVTAQAATIYPVYGGVPQKLPIMGSCYA